MKIDPNYDFYLFDFDGLLVDTEQLHYKAYKEALLQSGFDLPWSFEKYCAIAHARARTLKEEICDLFPLLLKRYPDWSSFYALKQQKIIELLKSEDIALMPGGEALLEGLLKAGVAICVVTNSTKEMIEIVKGRISILKDIEHWVVREDYRNSKPDGDPYLTAVRLYGEGKTRPIGFEDTMIGLRSLKHIPAQRVLVCSKEHPQLKEGLEPDVLYYESLAELL